MRKIRLLPLQREILWMLLEAGAEDVSTVLNTLRLKSPDSSFDEFLYQAESAIGQLFEYGLISFARDYETPGLRYVATSPEEIGRMMPVGKIVKFDEDKGHWIQDESHGEPHRISLVITEQGKESLTR